MNRFEIVSTIVRDAAAMVKPGVTGLEIDTFIAGEMDKYKVKSFNKGYKPDHIKNPFPNVSCINVNSVIAHGIPDNHPFKNGDIVAIDTSIIHEGLCADVGMTVAIGEIPKRAQNLLKYAKGALYHTIGYVKAGVSTELLAQMCQQYVMIHGFVVSRRFVGHTIGEKMHEQPMIPHSLGVQIPKGDVLVEGQIICLEPMLTYRDDTGVVLEDGWTTCTRDGSPSAFFEHMVEVTKDGYKILTNHFV